MKQGININLSTIAQGERESDFINLVLWRKSAENFSNFTHKGSLVGIEGRLQSRTYDDKDGKKVYVTEVVVDKFALLEPKNSGTHQKAQNAPQSVPTQQTHNQPQATQTRLNGAPAQQNQQSAGPFAQHGEKVDISEDDLPFLGGSTWMHLNNVAA
ncbi:single-stranded DNA-binding protein [Lacticaseibacillus pabuli]|uniref:Single-stranded DNA-binding protein n=1 Tax=Lacticaseibacillus pabuli TaxID=3025672 RepID=A0ABY7WV05_9LACO|nr:single-stranded DNA-binding protein [Lacticaseibacillus sp. KACC 23028]WDF83614.1 single-stranded DNA-binding protein [Lacticaseibacillus sp. KACC 23028]